MQLDVVTGARSAGQDERGELCQTAPCLPALETGIGIVRIIGQRGQPDRGGSRPGNVRTEAAIGEGSGEGSGIARAVSVPDGDTRWPEVAELCADKHAGLGPEPRGERGEGVLQRQVAVKGIAPVGNGFDDTGIDGSARRRRRRLGFNI